jgi:hypothetical protein
MDDLLAGTAVGSGKQLHEAAPLTIEPCRKDEAASSARLAYDLGDKRLAALAMLASLDGAGSEGTNANEQAVSSQSRVPDALCSAEILKGTLVLRAPAGAMRSIDGRTRLIVILSDAGRMLELVETPRLGFVMLHHDVGTTKVLPGWTGVPSNRQLEEMLAGGNPEATRVLAEVVQSPGKSAEVHLMPTSDEKAKAEQVPEA